MRHYAAIWSDKRLLGAVAFVIVARMVTWSYIELGSQQELAASVEASSAQRVRPAPAPPLPKPSAEPRKALVLPDLDEEAAGDEVRVREVLPDGSPAPSPLLPLVVAGAGGGGVLLLCGVAALLFLRRREQGSPSADDPWYGDDEIRRLVEEAEGRSP